MARPKKNTTTEVEAPKNVNVNKRSSQNLMDKLREEVAKVTKQKTSQKTSQDNRYWQPTVDKTGNGYAVIRFLPAKEGEEIPFVRLWNHGFQGPTGSWYIENSLTTLGQDDPVSELNKIIWARGDDESKKVVRNQKRKLNYISNILVIKDPAHPEFDGQVFLYKYGKKIFDKLLEKLQPEFEDETPMNPFDPDEGAPFTLKIRKVEGYRNYDKSAFGDIETLDENEDKIQEILKKTYSLQDEIAPSKFKTYEQLKARLDLVLNGSKQAPKPPQDDDGDEPEAPQTTKATAFVGKTAQSKSDDDGDGEDGLDFFRKLAEKDTE